MTKRILSFLIVLAMVMSVLPVHMVASADSVTHTHSDAHKCSEQCAGGTVTWTPWGVTNGTADTFPTTSGHYYLECDLTLTARNDIPAGQDVTVCLNGWNITETGSGNVSYVSGYLTIADCTAKYDPEDNYISGAITGCNASDGGCFNVRRGGKLVLESGKLTGNKATGGGGAVSLQTKNSTSKGGLFYMYGGEITGNSATNGGGVVANSGGEIYIYGGKLENNTSTGSGTAQGGGAIYLVGDSTLLIAGGEITGNKAKLNKDNVTVPGVYVSGANALVTVSGAPVVENIHFANAAAAGLRVNGLKTGAQIVASSVDKTATAQKLVKLAEGGAQTGWDSGWITLNDEPVSMENGGFVSGEIAGAVRHNHSNAHKCSEQCAGGTVTWTPWGVTNGTADKLPTVSGHYYLECDLTLTARNDIPAGTDITICLNGWNITETGTGNISYVLGNLTIADCTAYYEGETYISGAVTGCSFSDGGCFNVRRGGKLVLESGKLTGNKVTGGGGAVSLQTASGDSFSAFHMYGGEITGNSATSGGGVVANNGGQIYIHGGRIENNTDKNGGSAIYLVGADSRLTVSGSPRINQIYFDNVSNPGLQVAGLEGGTRIVATSKDKTMTADKLVKLAAGATQENWDTGWVTLNGEIVSLGDEGFVSGEIVPVEKHIHCEDGKTDCGHSQESWTLWNNANSLPAEAGNYCLANDVNLTGRWNVSNSIKLCLNGHTITQTQAGQRILNVTSGTVVLTDCSVTPGKLTGGTATADGGAIRVEGASATLKAYNLAIAGNTTTGHGGAVFIYNQAKAEFTNVEIFANEAGSTGGAITVREGGQLTMIGCTVEENTGKADGGGIYAHKNSVTTIIDTVISDNESKASAGGIGFGGSGAKATLTNVTISGNKAPNGAGMIVQGSSQVTATEMIIQDNTASNHGGAVYVVGGNTLTLEDSEITGNTAKANGGIYVAGNANVNIVSTQITGNTAASGGGVYVCANANVTLEGETVIRSNQGGNLDLIAGKTVQAKALTQGASVYVSAGRGAFTGPCEDYTDYFLSDSPYQMVSYVDGAMYMDTASEYYHKHCPCDGTVGSCDHTGMEWNVWDKTDSLPTSGTYYLLSNVVLKGETSVSGELTLCLNGHTVTAAENKRILSTPKDAEAVITISDCKGTGKLTGGVDVAKETGGGAIFIRAKGTLNLYGGAITGNKSITAGGAILLAGNATFNMYGGEISDSGARDAETYIDGGAIFGMAKSVVNIYGGKIANNTGRNGGAMYLDGTLTISGGVIEGNYGSQQGGAVYAKNGDLTVSGGQILNNNSLKDGGGLYYRGGKAVISGGTVSGNTSKSSGGGYSFSGNAQVTMTGGTVTGNVSPNGGGMVVQGGAHLELQGGQFIGNTSTGSAGGVYISTNSSITMTGGIIAENKANGNTGGLYITGATGKITGGEIKNNSSVKDGAGIYCVAETGYLELGGDVIVSGNETKGAGGGVGFTKKSSGKISGGIIEKNKAVNAGGIIIQGSSKLEITDGTLKNNTATNSGGGIYVNNSTLKFSGGKITGNLTQKSQGGGIYCYNSPVDISGGTISYNTSQKDGGGVYVNKATLRLSGGVITGNQSVKGSGGGFGATKEGHVIMTGGTVSYNKASNAAGAVIQSKAHIDMYGGTFCYNEGKQGAGIYVNNASGNLQGGTIRNNKAVNNAGGGYAYNSKMVLGKNLLVTENHSDRYAGGLYFNQGTLEMTGTKFTNNTSKMGGSGFYTFKTECTIKDPVITGNKSTDSTGGGVVLSRQTLFNWEGGVIENNYAKYGGGGMLIQNWAEGTIKGLTIANNEATEGGGGLFCYTCVDANFVDCTISGNKTGTSGGGVFLSSPRGSFDPLSYINFTGCEIYDNEAADKAGGVYISYQIVSKWTDCKIRDNKAAKEAAGLYSLNGSVTTFENVKMTGNESGASGSALCIGDDFTMHNVTITGNKAAEGAAVVFPVNNFDGESYQMGHYTMSGDIIIADNQGTMQDLYIPAGTAIGSTGEGFGKNTKIHVQLESGILTNTIQAAYNYEGGDLIYTITYGDRSTREPEYEAPINPEETPAENTQNAKSAKGGDIWLYVGIGAVIVVIAAVAVVIGKKKKSAGAEQK